MKTMLFFLILIWPTYGLAELPALFQTQATTHIPEDVQKFVAHLKQKNCFTALFEQEKHIQSLSRPLKSEGKFVYCREKGFVWDLVAPIETTSIITANTIEQREPGKKAMQFSRGSNESIEQITGLFFLLFDGDLNALTENFALYVTPHKRQTIGLVPSKDPVRDVLSGMVLTFSNTVQSIEIWEKNGDHVKIAFRNEQPSDPTGIDTQYFSQLAQK